MSQPGDYHAARKGFLASFTQLPYPDGQNAAGLYALPDVWVAFVSLLFMYVFKAVLTYFWEAPFIAF